MIKHIALATSLLLGLGALGLPAAAQAATGTSAVCDNPAFDQSLVMQLSTDDEDALQRFEALGNRCASPASTATPRAHGAEVIMVKPLPHWLERDLRPYRAS